jgi:hypothetical protein
VCCCNGEEEEAGDDAHLLGFEGRPSGLVSL